MGRQKNDILDTKIIANFKSPYHFLFLFLNNLGELFIIDFFFFGLKNNLAKIQLYLDKT
jgi:hypothetical protein